MQGRFGRIVLVISALATLGLVWVGVDGYRLSGASSELRPHLGKAMAVALALLFGHCWVALYLAGLARTLRHAQLAPGLPEPAWSWRDHRSLAAAIAVALALLLTVFLLGPAAMLEMLPAWAHGVAFFAALLAQLLALVLETRELRAADAQLAALYRSLG